MVMSEEQLLAQLESCGFDFTATARDIATRFPREVDSGAPSRVVLAFQLTQPFAGFGLDWRLPVSRDLDFDLPPAVYVQDFHPTDNVRTNFDLAVERLTAVLGEGQVVSASNAIERSWRIGFFTIRVIAWPKELNAMFHNAGEGSNPHQWIDAKGELALVIVRQRWNLEYRDAAGNVMKAYIDRRTVPLRTAVLTVVFDPENPQQFIRYPVVNYVIGT